MAEQGVNFVIKRDGSTVLFNPDKITTAISKALNSVGKTNFDVAKQVTLQVIKKIEEMYKERPPAVENIQDIVEASLIEAGHTETAKSYILYRQKRRELRELRSVLLDGKQTNTGVSENSLLIFRERYLLRDESGRIKETPEDLFRRVAKAAAELETRYGENSEQTAEEFYQLMFNLEFLPSSPTLMNAQQSNQLFPAFVLPIPDNLEGIYDTLRNAVLVHKCGGGTGFNFSNIRPKNDLVKMNHSIAPGPVSIMNVFDTALSTVLQNGKRQGGNMAILRVDHPDIFEFITLKEKNRFMNNFNLSVAVDEAFMNAVEQDALLPLKNPKTNEVVQRVPAKQIFDMLVIMAWRTGDPGIIFIDRLNSSKSNPMPDYKEIEATNPCAEQPLFPYEACPFGSINLSKMIVDNKIDVQKLKETVHKAVRFLDNLIDINNYPLKETETICKLNRRIGLGVMGFADLLFQLKVPYDSENGIELAKKIMQIISIESEKTSQQLAEIRGAFPNFEKSIYSQERIRRNASITTISPTGSISALADCSPGIEPVYALSFIKRVLNGKELICVNSHFEQALKKAGIYSEELMKKIAANGSIQNIEEIPADIKEIFKVSHDIPPYWHVRMQAAFQLFTDNAISKTVNFPNWSTIKEVEEVYMLAYKLGCKGITIYRDGSKDNQVFNLKK